MSGGGTVQILGIAGSLRRGSFNAATLRAAQELTPAGMTIESFDISAIPLYNEDVRQQGFPAPVEDLRARIKAADGLLIVTPEYNYSIPGVLKNAIDWASRPPEQPFDGKPIGVMGASAGIHGTSRAQYHLRQCFVFLNGLVMNRPEVMIPQAQNKFDGQRQAQQSGDARVHHRAPGGIQGVGAAAEVARYRVALWYSRLGIMSVAEAMRFDRLKNATVSDRSKMSSSVRPASCSAARSASSISQGVVVIFHA
jgi:chromate reductase, NAD(P)H dehydrogenase (quinone)